MTDISRHIKSLIQSNKQATELLQQTFNGGADEGIIAYCSHLMNNGYNSTLSLPFVNVLKFASNPEIANQIDTKDIEMLLDSYLELNGFIEHIYTDAANFIDNDLGKKEKAKMIIATGIAKIKEELSELEELQSKI